MRPWCCKVHAGPCSLPQALLLRLFRLLLPWLSFRRNCCGLATVGGLATACAGCPAASVDTLRCLYSRTPSGTLLSRVLR